jgi:hypothetical protein
MDPAMDTSTPAGRLVFNVIASIAQFEREIMLTRRLASQAQKDATGCSASSFKSQILGLDLSPPCRVSEDSYPCRQLGDTHEAARRTRLAGRGKRCAR